MAFLSPVPAKPTNGQLPSSCSSLPLSLLPRCRTAREIQQLHGHAIKTRLQHHLPTLSALIHSCSRLQSTSSLAHARRVFDTIPQPHITLLNVIARGYASSTTPEHAFLLLSDGLSLGLMPDHYTFPSVIKACACAKALEEGRQAHALAVKLGFRENEFVRPTVINMYSECGDMHAAWRFFKDADGRQCIVSFNSMITACVRSSRPGEALALFREMQAAGLPPDNVTILGILSSCALVGSLELGRWIHEYVKKSGRLHSSVKVNTALIDMYAKCGSLEDAVSVFEGMESRDTQAWSAMIMAHAIHGRGDVTLSLFEKMRRDGIKPDAITFVGLLYACSHSGLVEKGLEIFHSMKDVYRIEPDAKHFGCVVDLLSRAGRLEEAYDFIENLPIKPTAILWRPLLSACGVRRDVDLARRVFERILELDDSHGGDYVAMSNLCAIGGRSQDVDHIRKLMKERNAAKLPGCSSIEIGNTVHEFFAADVRHPQTQKLRVMLDELLEQLKVVGYVPDISSVFHMDIGEKDKEISLRYHSEKMAIAFGLLNSPPGTTIRVVKNLRVCSDCHSVAKLISLVFDRKIILRDQNRFHHFENGECSCKGYW